MSGKVTCVLLVALLVSGASSRPESPEAAGDARETNVLRQLIGQKEAMRDASAAAAAAAARHKPAPGAQTARAARRAHLSEDEREIMTKQIMQAISEMMNSECMLDRDYQGWVDFGRREAE